MSLAGGAAAKDGVTYEALWTAYTLAQLLIGEISAVRLEPPLGDGVEFTVERPDGSRQRHQCKTRTDRSWTIRDLRLAGVLRALVAATTAGDEFVFVSDAQCRDIPILAKLARQAETYEDFIAGLGSDRADRFRGLSGYLGVEEPQAWACLQRTVVHVQDGELLRENAQYLLAGEITSDPRRALSELIEYSLVKTRQRITSARIWGDLGYTRRRFDRDPTLLGVLERIQSAYLEAADAETIAGITFARTEVNTLLEMVTGSDPRARVVVSADAGDGKSGVLAQLVRELSARSILCLPFRLDRMPPAHQPDELGRALGLPASPAIVLKGASAGERAVLVIDQLDAVSQVSGRSPEFLGCVEAILREARAFTNVSVVLACRRFDLDADPKLAALKASPDTEVVPIGGLSDHQVDEVLGVLAIEPASLTSAQRSILASPLNLRLLSEAPSKEFRSVADLYARVWDAKRRKLSKLAPNLSDIVRALCAAAARRRRLFVPRDVVAKWDLQVEATLSEGLLIEAPQGPIGFFHEGFFDFIAAKVLAEEGTTLRDFLISTDQDLFHRSQTRQILAYRRETDFEAYVRDVQSVLASPDIRFHLKSLTTDWLRTLADPTMDEWRVMEPLITLAADPLSIRLINVLRTPAWFDLADQLGVVERWLFSDEEALVNAGVSVLQGVQRSRGARVADLLAKLPRTTETWRSRIRWLVQQADLAADRQYFDLVVALTRDGTLDGVTTVFVTNGSFWDLGRELNSGQIGWFAELAAAYLNRRADLALEAGVRNPFQGNMWIPDPLDRSLFSESARAAPLTYITELLPFMRRIIEATAQWDAEEKRWDDAVWRFRWPDGTFGVEHALLAGMEEALGLLAKQDATEFKSIIRSMAEAQAETFDYLIIRGFTKAPTTMAEDAATFLLERPSRLHAGYMSDSHWAARELVSQIAPFLAAETWRSLERAVLNYYPNWERTPRALGHHGAAQHTILGGVATRLVGSARKRYDELARKFGENTEAPIGHRVGAVQSPISPASADRMNDEQWLRAISKYQEDGIGRRGLFTGGARELAHLLGERVATHPARFLPLILRLPDQTNEAYFEAALRALAKAHGEADRNLVWDLVRRIEGLPVHSCTREISDVVGALADTGQVPDDIIDIVASHATRDDDPAGDEHEFEDAPSGDEDATFAPSGYEQMELVNRGLNTDRGRAALAIGKILWAQPMEIDRLQATLSALAADTSRAVRVCAIEALLPVLNLDRDKAVELYVAAVGNSVEVAASQTSARFLRFALRTHYKQVEPVLEFLLDADHDAANRVGAREAVLASFDDGDRAVRLVERAMKGTRGARFGAAEVYAANIADEMVGSRCDDPLRILFHDPDSKVRAEAGSAFRSFDRGQLAHHLDLLPPFISSPALADEPSDVLHALLRIEGQIPEVAADVCLRVLELAGAAAGNMRTAQAADAPDIASIAVRLNAFGSERGRIRGLDVFDRLCEVGAYGTDKALEAYSRF